MTRATGILLAAAITLTLGLILIPLAAHNIEHAQESKQAAAQPAAAPPPASNPQPAVKTAPPTPIAEKKAELGDNQTWDPDWDVAIEKSLPVDMLGPKAAHAVKAFCPRFSHLSDVDKRAFWAYFFQALAGAEAGLVPTKDVRHTEPQLAVVDDVTHRMVRQEGLLQLTYMDQERYGCDFDWEKDKDLPEHDPNKTILQPEKNLLCGVNIIHNQLIEQHKPLLSSTSYFSTLQPGTASVKVFLKQMANVPAPCGRRPAREETKPAAASRIASVSTDRGTPEPSEPSTAALSASGQP